MPRRNWIATGDWSAFLLTAHLKDDGRQSEEHNSRDRRICFPVLRVIPPTTGGSPNLILGVREQVSQGKSNLSPISQPEERLIPWNGSTWDNEFSRSFSAYRPSAQSLLSIHAVHYAREPHLWNVIPATTAHCLDEFVMGTSLCSTRSCCVLRPRRCCLLFVCLAVLSYFLVPDRTLFWIVSCAKGWAAPSTNFNIGSRTRVNYSAGVV